MLTSKIVGLSPVLQLLPDIHNAVDKPRFLKWGHDSCLMLSNHVHDFHTGECCARRMKILETEFWLDDSLDQTMILFGNIIQVLNHPVLNSYCKIPKINLYGNRDFRGRIPVGGDHSGYLVVL